MTGHLHQRMSLKLDNNVLGFLIVAEAVTPLVKKKKKCVLSVETLVLIQTTVRKFIDLCPCWYL